MCQSQIKHVSGTQYSEMSSYRSEPEQAPFWCVVWIDGSALWMVHTYAHLGSEPKVQNYSATKMAMVNFR